MEDAKQKKKRKKKAIEDYWGGDEIDQEAKKVPEKKAKAKTKKKLTNDESLHSFFD